MENEKKYKKAVVGGTFDHFHLGHEKLLATAIAQSDELMIGIATDDLFAHKTLAEQIEPYEVREKHVKEFITKHQAERKTTIMPISDIFGNTLDESAIEAIFVTEENIPNVHKINEKRQEIGFPELNVIAVEYVKDDNGENITSERIRKGEIDKRGFVYKNLFTESLHLSEDTRSKLRNPFGDILATTEDVLAKINEDTIVIAVGDIIVNSLIEKEYTPAISVIDFKTRREIIENVDQEQGEKVINAQGTINTAAVNALQQKINQFLETNHQQILVIDGEEDLLALPAILLAPLGAIVLYGQFDQGVVINHVTERVKRNARNFLI
ncbi:MAG TPA: pantetheine-phosphate adenylyltransferase [Patescibacteria group bacterium]|nr:pantetheine-phosphate adenylyltransferase [Patescibacteria group bacterium]